MHYVGLDCAFETKGEGDGIATFIGIASSKETDSHNDIIEAGAFGAIGPRQILLLRDHGRTKVVGGWRRFNQDGRYLVGDGESVLQVREAAETYSLMKAGHLSGLSVGFQAPDRDGIKQHGGRRIITKATLQECSKCVCGAETVDPMQPEWMKEHQPHVEEAGRQPWTAAHIQVSLAYAGWD